MGAINSCSNPVIYWVFMPAYRKAVKNLLCSFRTTKVTTLLFQTSESCGKVMFSVVSICPYGGVYPWSTGKPRPWCNMSKTTPPLRKDQTSGFPSPSPLFPHSNTSQEHPTFTLMHRGIGTEGVGIWSSTERLSCTLYFFKVLDLVFRFEHLLLISLGID